jgi:hypothetical protein
VETIENEESHIASDSVLVHHLQGVLEQGGIKTTLLNEKMSILSGEVPFFSTFLELWVVHDENETRAFELINQSISQDGEPAKATSPWECPTCHSLIEPQFTECWNCSGENPEQ